jgi:hypothetical protein
VHAGNEITMLCMKYMPEDLAKAFVSNTDETELARSLQEDSGDADLDVEIMSGFDKQRESHFVEVKFYTDIEDIEHVEKWCAAEGFEVIEKTFGSHV